MILALLLALASGDPVTVTLPMKALARGTEVELGEIAQIRSDDPELVKRVAAIELGYAPSPGYSRLFLAERIRATIARKAPELTIRIVGQEACRVFPDVEEIDGAEILASARVQLEEALGSRQASFEPAGTLTPVAVPAGAVEHSVRARLAVPPATSGPISIPVEILVDGVRYRTVWTAWDVRLWDTLPVLARPVRAGQALRPELFESRRVLVKSQGGAKPLGRDRIAGSIAVRDLSVGEVVADVDVHRPQVLQLGDSIFLRVKKGPIEAKVSAQALEGGAVGDKIRVRTLESSQELLAVIRTRDICELDLGR